MQAVILAAGRGRRLKPLTDDCPKGLIDFGGLPLIHYTLASLRDRGIKDILMVVGYRHEAFREYLGNQYQGLEISYIDNELYSDTGSMYSLSRAQNFISGDILLVESDLLFSPEAIDLILHSSLQNCILTAPLSGSGDEVFICVNRQGILTALGKDLPPEKRERAMGELVGISKLSFQFLEALFRQAEKDYAAGEKNRHYEECVFAASNNLLPVYALLSKDLVWTEIDNLQDLQKARADIFPRLHQLKR